MRDGGEDRRRFVRAVFIGSALALVADIALLAVGPAGLTGSGGAPAMLVDVQARAFLGGHLAVNATAAGIEGFVTHGSTYLYYGPVTALLHLPFLAIGGHGVDGHLTQLSMIAAYVVLLAATAVLHWRVRALLRPGAPFGRTDAAAALLLQVAVGAGAIPLYLAGWVAVYHEVELWGAALTIATLAALVGFLRVPSVRGAVWAGVLATLAVNTRLSVGYGAVAAIVVVGAAIAASMLPGRAMAALGSFGPPVPRERRGRLVLALAIAALVPIVTTAALNQAKFGEPFGLPLERQVDSHVDPNRQAALTANPSGLFGVKFVPTALLAYARPDAIGLARGFPFVNTPSSHPTIVGDLRFDTLDPSLSATTSMLLFCLLSIVAAVGLLRRRERRPLFAVLLASSVAMAGALTLAYITSRYLADLLPTLVLGAAAGITLIAGHLAVAGERARRGRRVALIAMAALIAFGFVVNGASGLFAQQLLHPQSVAARAGFVSLQDDVDRLLGRTPHGLRAASSLPAVADGRPGDLLVVEACDGLYAVGNSGQWLPVERTAATGLHNLAVRLPATTNGRWIALARLGGARTALTVEVKGSNGSMAFRTRLADGTVSAGAPVAVPAGRAVTMSVLTQPLFAAHYTTVSADGRTVASTLSPLAPGAPLVPLAASVRRAPTPTPVCDTLVRRARLSVSLHG